VLSGSLRGFGLALRGGVTFLPKLLIGWTSDEVKLWPATCALI